MKKGRESKPHIGIYGRRNYGKSSLINLLAGQNIAIVSDFAGTTTDPVKKSLEILNFGPVILIDTAGVDDSGDLGSKRVEKTLETIKHVDLALLLTAGNVWGDFEEMLMSEFSKFDTPAIIIHSKSDVEKANAQFKSIVSSKKHRGFVESSVEFDGCVDQIVELIRKAIPESSYVTPTLLGDIINPRDLVLLITPIDTEAPAGRMILPQVQAIRDTIDNDAIAIVLKESEVEAFFEKVSVKPSLAVTDSQIFAKANKLVPEDVPLTSYSILLARLKGNFDAYLKGTPAISELKDGDRVLLLESCSHHSTCDDIGRVKIPRWIKGFTNKEVEFDVVAGLDKLPRDIMEYSLVIQCGGCMITQKQLINRLHSAIEEGIPVTNYGMAIAYVQGIYRRAIAPFVK